MNSLILGLRDKHLSSLRNASPIISAQELKYNEPDIVKNCPNNLYDFLLKIIGTLKVDNEPFTFDHGHEYLVEPYRSVRITDRYDTEGQRVSMMCGAQVGKTVMAMMTEVFLACYFWGKYFGYFFPDREMALLTSGVRFKPLCLSIPEIAPLWGEDPTSEDKYKKKSDAQRVRSIGPSQIFFGYMGGRTSTESIPMLGMVFDEVRRMLDGDRERARERMSHSPYPFEMNISTAGYPGVTIDKEFKSSNQNKFHSGCKCSDGIVLADHFPACIGERMPGVTPSLRDLPDTFWVCPTCSEPIVNPATGRWITHYPTVKSIGWHIPQILSPRQSAAKIFTAFLEATDITEFYNSKLGIPHISKESQIVNRDILKATVDTDLRWPAVTGIYPRNCAAGIDQMLGFNVIVIRKWGPLQENGRRESQLVHVEWIANPEIPDFDPWKRCFELMKQYDVAYCVADSMPNGNDALAFANDPDLKGRVFLADYSYEAQKGEDICIWGDKIAHDPNRKADESIKSKYRVRISRYLAIEWNLMRYVTRTKRQPHERGLIGELPDRRKKLQREFICDTFWKHLMAVARRKHVLDETQDKFKMVFENVGLDPHFLHADLYCELALTRVHEGGHAFGDYVPAEEATEHTFERDEVNPEHYRCMVCQLALAVPDGMTPGVFATKSGFAKCEAGPAFAQ